MIFNKVLEEAYFPGKLGTGTRFENAKKTFAKEGVKKSRSTCCSYR